MEKLFFSQRRKLEMAIQDWISENNATNCPSNTIVFLEQNNLIDIKKAKDFIDD